MHARLKPAVVWLLALALPVAAGEFAFTPAERRALAEISPDELRANLSFIASEKLEGRDTPSHGLDVAAEYIAAQFRTAGIEPSGDDGYFQTAHMLRVTGAAFEIRLLDGERTFGAGKDEAVLLSSAGLELSGMRIYRANTAAELRHGDWRGRAILIPKALETVAAARHPGALLELAPDYETPRLIEPVEVPRVILKSGDAFGALTNARRGDTGLTVSLKLSSPTLVPAVVRNVIGVVRGSDPILRKQYILLTAHYDHLGKQADGIYPGANDDGSGTVSVIEIGKALAALHPHPKRTVVLMLFFGEEEGSLGSYYYVHHPVYPLARTVADVNLEQLGRTDSTDGTEVSSASLTGFDYSNVTATLRKAGALTGVRIYKAANDADYFKRSDNAPFAELGIPAHTVVVAYEFPDYHATGDVWQKIDYGNMAKIDRMIALATINLADSPIAPQWIPKNRFARR
jgi:hypothetical protein